MESDAELRDDIARYRNLLRNCTDAEARTVLRELLEELEAKLKTGKDASHDGAPRPKLPE